MTATAVISRTDRQQRRSQPQPHPHPSQQLRYSHPTPPTQKTHSIVRLMPSTTTCRLFSTRRCSCCCRRCQTSLPNQPSQNTPRKNLTPRPQQPDASPSNATARPATMGRTRLSSPQSGSRSYQRRRQRHRLPIHRRSHSNPYHRHRHLPTPLMIHPPLQRKSVPRLTT